MSTEERDHDPILDRAISEIRNESIEPDGTASSPGLTRLVLDLDLKARLSKHPRIQTEGVTIEIPNRNMLADCRIASRPWPCSRSNDSHSLICFWSRSRYQR